MTKLKISWGNTSVTARLRDTASVRALLEVLPCESSANTWGDEVFFKIPLEVELENDARQVVDPGTVCIWVEGDSLALPFGPTPISEGDECRLISRVNILGELLEDPQILASINDGDRIRLDLL